MGERKKVVKKPIEKVEPKKRVQTKPIPKFEPKKRVVDDKKQDKSPSKKIVLPPEPTETKAKKNEYKYVKIALDAPQEERRIFTERVQKGEIKLAYYAIDGEIGYHYYIVLKK